MMTQAKRGWSTINRVGPRGLLKGCWLVNPQGHKVATIMDETLARQLAAAMSLTTQAQRQDYLAEVAGYSKENR